jgi:type III restriction enzyme
MDMPKLVRGKFILEKVLQEKISIYRNEAYKKGYQACMFGTNAIVTVEPETFSFPFDPDNYPANMLYEGHIGFAKHYYPRIAIMNNEEAECAQAIDRNPLVKLWVRNLERQPMYSFWLQTSTDRFYPDFVVKLKDERLLVIEFKGEQFRGTEEMCRKKSC